MAVGSKKAYTSKQKRQAKHIEDSAKKSGKSSKTAARIAYATVNKQDGGGKKSGSGRGKKKDTSSSAKGGRKAAKSRTSTTKSRSSTTKSRSSAAKSRSSTTKSRKTTTTRKPRGGSKAAHARAGRASHKND